MVWKKYKKNYQISVATEKIPVLINSQTYIHADMQSIFFSLGLLIEFALEPWKS
jgi:hypothetical protein